MGGVRPFIHVYILLRLFIKICMGGVRPFIHVYILLRLFIKICMGGVRPFIHVYILKLFEDNKTTLAFDYNLLTCVHAPIPKYYDLQTSTPGQDAH